MKRDNLTEKVCQRLKRLPAPYDAHYGVVPEPPIEGFVTLTGAASHKAGMQAFQQADQIATLLPNHFPLSRVLVRQEAVNSSSIEGTHSTLDAVLESEEADDGDATEDEATTQVREYALALESALIEVQSSRRDGFTLELIQGLHKALMSNDPSYKDSPGRFREVVVWIGGDRIEHSTYNPTPPDDIASCMAEHIAYLRTDGMQPFEQSIILRLAIAHAHFEAIHPFRDGNGRVGRLLLPLMMAADGRAPLYLAPYFAAHKQVYYDALKSAQQRLDYAPLVELFSSAIINAVDEATETISAFDQLTKIWSKRAKFRAGSAAHRALNLLSAYPVVTAKRLATALGTTYGAANNSLSTLVSAGILTELTGHRRNRMYAAREVLRVFNRPFGEKPELPKA